jgi:DNA recombination protein RmuC
MSDFLLVSILAALAVIVGLLAALLWRMSAASRSRATELREAVRDAAELRTRLDAVTAQLGNVERDIRQDLAHARAEQGQSASGLRGEVGTALGRFGEQLTKLTQSNEQRLEAVRVTVEHRLDVLRNDNAQKLEQMRATVDEKLQATLEQRLGESFRIVSDRLEQVHRGLGEMQTLAVGVGDLKRVLANVKTRGLWGEVQLASLLAEVLTPQQYATNVETIPGSNERVEFAIRLPGRGEDAAPCWLPVDAKFPMVEWQRLQEALERADMATADDARKALADHLRGEAKKIRAKYVAPPYTTDFAILFVPTEGLYAEMMARVGFADTLQREHRVTLCGPTNLLALLNSLQLGFRTLAIEQRSHEVWRVLGAVRGEFGKFGDVLARAQKKLQEATNTIEEARGKTTTIARRLKDVEALPEEDAPRLVGSRELFDSDDAGDAK